MLTEIFVKFFSFICFSLPKPVQSNKDFSAVLELYCRAKFCFMEITLQFKMLGLAWKNPVVKIPHWLWSFTLLSLPANIIHAWMIGVLCDVKLSTSWMSMNKDRLKKNNTWLAPSYRDSDFQWKVSISPAIKNKQSFLCAMAVQDVYFRSQSTHLQIQTHISRTRREDVFIHRVTVSWLTIAVVCEINSWLLIACLSQQNGV